MGHRAAPRLDDAVVGLDGESVRGRVLCIFRRGARFRALLPMRYTKPGFVRVWGLRFWEDLNVQGEFELVKDIPLSQRQLAQRGCFTKLLSDKHHELEGYLKSRGKAHFLEAYDI